MDRAESDKRARSQNLKVLSSMMAFIKPYRWQVFFALLALTFTAATTLSIGQGIRFLVDQGFGADAVNRLNEAVGFFVLLAALLALGTFARFYLVSWIGERVSADLRRKVFEHVIDLHPGFFETNLSSEIQSRITTDTTLLQTVIGSSVSIALRNILMFVGGLIWLFITNPKLTGLVMLSVPVVVVPIIAFGRKVRALSRSSQDRVADAGSFVDESLKNIKVLQAFNQQSRGRERFSVHVESAFAVALQRIRQRAFLITLVIMLVLGAIAAMLWVGGHDVIAGRITAGELMAFVFYAVIVAGSVGAISEVYADLQRAAGATERLLELLQAEPLIQSPAQPQSLTEPIQGCLKIDQASFCYPSRPDEPAIEQVSLELQAGQSMALVGTSGAGKSTLIDLILRFYDLKSGSIYFDGVDIRQLDPQVLRQQIALVPQQPVLFTGTVMENIRYGCPESSDEDVRVAAQAAYASEFIARLPHGYDSEVGEGGVRLSGGQRQRIAIARAILKDPKLLLLDEATSALDAESEFQVQQALEQLMKDRSSIVIAHRLATVMNADTIVVLDQGQLVATGTHQELLTRSPLYARWAQLQFGEGAEKAS